MSVSTATALTRLMWLSIAAALSTIALKTIAWRITGSVGLLSDALESLVNLAAAVVGLVVVRVATTPPDEQHAYGHEKAEYFSAGVEGTLILVAAALIGWAAVQRLLDQAELEAVGVGAAVSAAASVVNLGVGLVLMRQGRRRRSIALESDGRHLLTDVWTSAGVIVGVLAVGITGWWWLDPVIAIAVALNIVATGLVLVRRAGGGLMDHALPAPEREALERALELHRADGVAFHAVRTRQAGRRSFVSMHVLVPGGWTVQRGHDLLERIEHDVCTALPDASVMTHLEPIEDPASLRDVELDRERP